MFERFNERARKVVALSQEEAKHFNHNYIGTEHLLLGLLREEEGPAAKALRSLNVTYDEVRKQVEEIVGYGSEAGVAKLESQVPFTPRAKKVLELAMREALQLGHNHVDTEHILLGLVREKEGVAQRIFQSRGIEPDWVRREVITKITFGGDRPRPASRRPKRPPVVVSSHGPIRVGPLELSYMRRGSRREIVVSAGKRSFALSTYIRTADESSVSRMRLADVLIKKDAA